MSAWLVAGVAAAALTGAAMALTAGQLVLVQMDRADIRSELAQMVSRMDDFTGTATRVILLSNEDQAPSCSDADLATLRNRLFDNPVISDIARRADGAIVCTAMWGRLETPMALGPVTYQAPSGADVWTATRDAETRRTSPDMIGFSRTVVYLSETEIGSRVRDLAARHPAVIYSRGTGQIFRTVRIADAEVRRLLQSWVDVAGNDASPGTDRGTGGPGMAFAGDIDRPAAAGMTGGDGRGETTTVIADVERACSRWFDVCIAMPSAMVSILDQPPLVGAGIGLLGGMAGGGLGLFGALRQRRGRSVEAELRRALARGRLRLVYQPVVHVRTGRVIGAEALLRLTTPSGRDIPTEQVIAVGERVGLMGQIARYAVRTALAEFHPYLTGPSPLQLGINVTVADLIDPAFLTMLDAETARHGVSPDAVALEITERSTTDYARLAAAITTIRSHGYHIHIDDFGTGYSGLAHLTQLPVDVIKIDRLFTSAIGTDAVSASIVPQIFSMAATLGVDVVVEGIETEAQALHLAMYHPDACAQGWYYGAPVPVGEFRAG
ncbi:cyclic diguanylate phosphodiesterase [Tistrella bauzanensis]|uniref:cyclic-guanylate-specific phosphodiesterase n=1 Tax=Tistrella bauzanensis TaxID=657419 RepID=A0ABQ1I7L4_9PROT|nr:EAL domain-containing protein [Tistrella bauzanensis]GGB24745.1 cyclic diguanylate phosphodiesterase [Tistrella bauzanensis]